MKVLIDANVLFPTVMREVVMGVAAAGIFQPQWSARILDEWAHAASRLGADVAAQAKGEIAMLTTRWPQATVRYAPELEQRLWLPDPADVHVLAAAIAGSSDIILTSNATDFPRHILAEEGLSRADPDGFLLGCYEADPDRVAPTASAVLAEAQRLSGQPWTMRRLMKKARLPRLGRALERAGL